MFKIKWDNFQKFIKCTTPKIIFINLIIEVPSDINFEQILIDEGYSVVDLRKRNAKNITKIIESTNEDNEKVLAIIGCKETIEEIDELCEAIHTKIYFYPNNSKKYRESFPDKSAADIKNLLEKNKKIWTEHNSSPGVTVLY